MLYRFRNPVSFSLLESGSHLSRDYTIVHIHRICLVIAHRALKWGLKVDSSAALTGPVGVVLTSLPTMPIPTTRLPGDPTMAAGARRLHMQTNPARKHQVTHRKIDHEDTAHEETIDQPIDDQSNTMGRSRHLMGLRHCSHFRDRLRQAMQVPWAMSIPRTRLSCFHLHRV